MPYSYFNSFITTTGLVVKVRAMKPDDAPHLIDLFEHMGPDSRYNRFLQSVDHVGMERIWQEAEKIAGETQGRSYGIVACADLPERDDVVVAAARYLATAPNRAEIGVSVRDDMQRMGIGTGLLNLLARCAAEHGITELTGTVQNSNAGVWAMFRKLGFRMERVPQGSYSEVTLFLEEPAAERQRACPDVAADFSPESKLVW